MLNKYRLHIFVVMYVFGLIKCMRNLNTAGISLLIHSELCTTQGIGVNRKRTQTSPGWTWRIGFLLFAFIERISKAVDVGNLLGKSNVASSTVYLTQSFHPLSFV